MDQKNTLRKYERLYHQTDIDTLFAKGKRFVVYPYKVVFLEVDDGKPTCRMLVSVSKKLFHHAVGRNHMKRLTREAWRTNKNVLTTMCLEGNISMNVALIYNATVRHSLPKVESSMKKIVAQLQKEHEKAQTSSR